MLAREIAHLRRGRRIAMPELGEDQVFLAMMVELRVDLEIGDDAADHFVIRAAGVIENIQLMLENVEQPLDVAVFPGQNVDDHGTDPGRRLDQSIDEKTVTNFALDQGASRICAMVRAKRCRMAPQPVAAPGFAGWLTRPRGV